MVGEIALVSKITFDPKMLYLYPFLKKNRYAFLLQPFKMLKEKKAKGKKVAMGPAVMKKQEAKKVVG